MPKTDSDKKVGKKSESKVAPKPVVISAHDKALIDVTERLKTLEEKFERLCKSHRFIY